MFNEYRVVIWKDENILEMDGADVSIFNTIMLIYLMPMNCTLKNG